MLPERIFPPKLSEGDTIRVVAPSRSLSLLSKENRELANARFEAFGFNLTFGKNVELTDDFVSSPIESRVQDIHEAFEDTSVKAVITVIGGFNSNQLLRYLDYDLIGRNPKILCGYSDITALANAIHAKTGLVTYSGPHYSTMGCRKGMEYSIEHWLRCLTQAGPFWVFPSESWSDDKWYMDQEHREFISNPGPRVLNEGEAEGRLIGGNLCTLNLLQGTEFMPNIENTVLFIEDDYESQPVTFDRDLQSLIHQPGFETVRGLVIGRFQKGSHMTGSLLDQIIRSKRELANMPVIVDADFGHSQPMFTFPIGGDVRIGARGDEAEIVIERH